jgi:hypothetical protein
VGNKRFEDWDTVECSECARYWDSSCDGVTGSQKPCNSFLATRSILIPEKLKRLEKSVKWLTTGLAFTDGVLIVYLLIHLLGGCNG